MRDVLRLYILSNSQDKFNLDEAGKEWYVSSFKQLHKDGFRCGCGLQADRAYTIKSFFRKDLSATIGQCCRSRLSGISNREGSEIEPRQFLDFSQLTPYERSEYVTLSKRPTLNERQNSRVERIIENSYYQTRRGAAELAKAKKEEKSLTDKVGQEP